MRITNTKKKNKIEAGGQVNQITRATAGHFIRAYEEQCPVIKVTKRESKLKSKALNAHELFNLFTADIIKTNITFTR